MTCAEARERMLVADPSVLAGERVGGGEGDVGDRRLAEHLEACARCRRVARVLVEEQESLARALDAAAAGWGDAQEPVRESLPAQGGKASVEVSFRPRWWTAAAGAALAAAAALALWLVPGGLDLTRGPPSPVVEIGGETGPGGFELVAPAAEDVAVFRTGDPDVIVVWRLRRDGSS